MSRSASQLAVEAGHIQAVDDQSALVPVLSGTALPVMRPRACEESRPCRGVLNGRGTQSFHFRVTSTLGPSDVACHTSTDNGSADRAVLQRIAQAE